MSVAEMTLTNSYWEMLRNLSDDIKLRLASLLTSSVVESREDEQAASSSVVDAYTIDELRARLRQSEEDVAAGRVYMAEDVEAKMESKYPWLCES